MWTDDTALLEAITFSQVLLYVKEGTSDWIYKINYYFTLFRKSRAFPKKKNEHIGKKGYLLCLSLIKSEIPNNLSLLRKMKRLPVFMP